MPGEINPTLRHLHLFDLLLPLLAALAMTTTMTSVATATTTTTSCRMSEDQPDPAEDDHLPPPLRVVVNDTDHLSCYPVREATCANDRRMVCVESDACRGRRRTTTTTRRRRRRRRSLSDSDKERLYWKYLWTQASSIGEPESWRQSRRRRWNPVKKRKK